MGDSDDVPALVLGEQDMCEYATSGLDDRQGEDDKTDDGMVCVQLQGRLSAKSLALFSARNIYLVRHQRNVNPIAGSGGDQR